MNRIEKMNEIRNHCGIKPTEKSFFYRDEFIAILEMITDKVDTAMSIKDMIATYLPNWESQNTSDNHPSITNVDYVLSLIENKGVDAQDVPPNIDDCIEIAELSNDNFIGLTDFIIQGLNDKFSHKILAVSVCPNNPKQFTIILK